MPTIQMPRERLAPAIEKCLASLEPPVTRDRNELRLVLLHVVAAALAGLPPNAVAAYMLELTKLLDNTDAVWDAKFPRGMISRDDEGALPVAFTVKNNTVVLDFRKSLTWIGLGAEDARKWAAKLVELADRIEQ